MGVKYTPEMLAKMGLKILPEKRGDLRPVSDGEVVGATKTGESQDLRKEPKKKREKSTDSPKGTDCGFFLILLRQQLGLEAVEEHPFHPERKWRFDVAIPSLKIAVEIEGGIWKEGGGAHSRPANILRDIEKYNAAIMEGWKVLRVVPEDLHKTHILTMIHTLKKQHET